MSADVAASLVVAGPPTRGPQAQELPHHGRSLVQLDPSPPPGEPLVVGAGPLDLHEGIVEPPRFEDPRTGCPRWPAGLLLKWRRGELNGYVEGRCGATNLCRYCQRLYVIETVEMLTLDAMEHAPELWVVLTAREHLTRSDCRRHLEAVRRSCRKRWPEVQWFVQVEFQRRGALHLNLLVKGVPVEDRDRLLAVMTERWCERVDAEPVGQHLELVKSGTVVIRYLSKMLAHGLKAEQAPPIGWKGHRTSQTRGYLVRPAAVMRQEAKRALQLKRELFKVERRAPELDAATVFDIAEELVARHAQRVWELVALEPLRAEALVAGMVNPPRPDQPPGPEDCSERR